jgi:hypothetical protein
MGAIEGDYPVVEDWFDVMSVGGIEGGAEVCMPWLMLLVHFWKLGVERFGVPPPQSIMMWRVEILIRKRRARKRAIAAPNWMDLAMMWSPHYWMAQPNLRNQHDRMGLPIFCWVRASIFLPAFF